MRVSMIQDQQQKPFTNKQKIKTTKNQRQYIYTYICRILFLIIIGYILKIASKHISSKLLTNNNNHSFSQKFQADPMLDLALQQLFQIPYNQHLRMKNYINNNLTLAGNKKYFAYRISFASQPTNNNNKNNNNKVYQILQHYYFNKIYQIQINKRQLPICLIVTSKLTAIPQQILDGLLKSIAYQDYQNYFLYLNLEGLNKKAEQIINRKYKKRLKDRTGFLYYQKMSRIDTKDWVIRRDCIRNDNQIVVDIPIYGQLIGRQVLSILNKVYQQNQQKHLIYTNYLFRQNNIIRQGHSSQLSLPEYNFNNIIKQFSILPLRTFRFIQYLKINHKEFKKYRNRNKWSQKQTDIYFYTKLAQIWGPQHLKYLDQYLYYSRQQKSQAISDTFLVTIQHEHLTGQEKQQITAVVQPEAKEHYERIFQIRKQETGQYIRKRNIYIRSLKVEELLEKHPKLTGISILHKTEDDKQYAKYMSFLYQLWKYPERENYALAERVSLEEQFRGINYQQELPFCIVADGMFSQLYTRVETGLVKNQYTSFLASVSRLVYENYKLIITLNQPDQFRRFQVASFIAKNYPNLMQKTTIIFINGILPNGQSKQNMIKNYCQQPDLVIPLQITCQFIGRQALKLFNHLYKTSKTPNPNLFYTSHISIQDSEHVFKFDNIQASDAVEQQKFDMKNHVKKLNHQVYWNSYYMFAFKRVLFDRIDPEYIYMKRGNIFTEDQYRKQLIDGFIYKGVLNISEGLVDYQNYVMMHVPRDNFVIQETTQLIALEKIGQQPRKTAQPKFGKQKNSKLPDVITLG